MNDGGTHMDQRSGELFFFEEADGTNHSLTIRNLDYETHYEVTIEVFNRVSHLQFFLISELFQAGMKACHTQEQ